jgi:hypothetical protein
MDGEFTACHPVPASFCLDPERPVGEQLAAVLHEQLEAAQKALKRLSRKRLRRAGAALAAMERIAAVAGLLAAVDPDFAATIRARLQPATCRIDPWRQVWMRRGLFDSLFCTQVYASQPAFAEVRVLCLKYPPDEEDTAEPSPKAAAAAAIADLEGFPFEAQSAGVMAGFSVADLRAGLSGSYAECHRRMRAAGDAHPDSWELARRQVEHYHQQLQLLGELASPERGRISDYRRFAELLTLDRGLASLRERLRTLVRVRNEARYQPFIDVVADRRQLLRLQIESLDAALFGA